jgi:hypothetical protein
MIEPDWQRPVKTVKVQQRAFGGGVNELCAAALFQVDDDAKAIHQNMLLKFGYDTLRRDVRHSSHSAQT